MLLKCEICGRLLVLKADHGLCETCEAAREHLHRIRREKAELNNPLTIHPKPGQKERWIEAVKRSVEKGAQGNTLENVTIALLNEWSFFMLVDREEPGTIFNVLEAVEEKKEGAS